MSETLPLLSLQTWAHIAWRQTGPSGFCPETRFTQVGKRSAPGRPWGFRVVIRGQR